MAAIATGIPTRHLGQVWPDLWPIIKPVYDMQADKRDLLAGLYSRDLQLWGIFSSVPLAVIVTRLWLVSTSGPTEKHCRIWLVSGVRMTDWFPDFIAKLIAWAKVEGCDCLTASGRPGWARLVRQYGGFSIPDEDGMSAWRLNL